MDFIRATVDGGGADNWSYKCAKLQSNRHYQQTIIHLFCRPDVVDTLPVAQPTVSEH